MRNVNLLNEVVEGLRAGAQYQLNALLQRDDIVVKLRAPVSKTFYLLETEIPPIKRRRKQNHAVKIYMANVGANGAYEVAEWVTLIAQQYLSKIYGEAES